MKNTIPLNTILKRVCDYFQLTEQDMRKIDKSRKIAYPRHIYAYIAKNHSGKSFEKIGKKINRYHATIQFSVRKIKSEKDLYSSTLKDIQEIEKSFHKIDFVVSYVDLLQIAYNNTENQN